MTKLAEAPRRPRTTDPKVCWRTLQPAIKIGSTPTVTIQQTKPSKAKTAGQRLGRQVCRVSKFGRQANTTIDLRLWGRESKVDNQDQAPGHPPFPLVSAYGEWIWQRPANTPAANPGQQTPPRGLLTTQGVCCG